MAIKIGVLALQGGFSEHIEHLSLLNDVQAVEVRHKKSLEKLSGLIIPGGESTTMARFLQNHHWYSYLIEQAKNNKMAIWGTCAGAILLSRSLENNTTKTKTLALLDISIERNAYGRQIDSFSAKICPTPAYRASLKKAGEQPMVFIRAPKIKQVGKKVQVIAHLDGDPVAIQNNNLLATTFHPELTSSLIWHQYFIENCILK